MTLVLLRLNVKTFAIASLEQQTEIAPVSGRNVLSALAGDTLPATVHAGRYVLHDETTNYPSGGHQLSVKKLSQIIFPNVTKFQKHRRIYTIILQFTIRFLLNGKMSIKREEVYGN